MKFLSKSLSAFLWLCASIALIAAVLSVVSFFGLIRFATVSDGTAAPLALNGSLAVAMQVDTSSVEVGDALLVGSHTSEGSAIGEVISIEETPAGNTAVILKAPALAQPDQWSYELAGTTYQQLFAVPLIGYPFAALGQLQMPLASAFLLGVFAFAAVLAYRYFLFRLPEPGEARWFAKLEKSNEDNLKALQQIFVDAGVTAPVIIEEERRTWTPSKREA